MYGTCKLLAPSRLTLLTFFPLAVFEDFRRFISESYVDLIIELSFPFLSYCCIAALWRSIKYGTFTKSVELMSARHEVFQNINRALDEGVCNGTPRVDDAMLYSLKHQLFVDIHLGDASSIIAHINGLDMMVHVRGGLFELELECETGEGLKV